MNNDTMKDIINDVRDLASVSDAMTRLGLDGIANRLEQLVERGLYITPKAALDVVAGERPLDKMLKTPIDEEENVPECMSRAEATRILMQLQAVEARDGLANINAALEMAISCIVKKHRNVCRNKAKRRAARMANEGGRGLSHQPLTTNN